MVFLTLSLLLAAEPLPAPKLAAPGLNTTGIDAAVAAPLTDHLALAFSKVQVITPRDINVLLGIERQKQLMGCSEDAEACVAELGNALGVQGVLLGDIVKLGSKLQINLRILDPVSGRELASASERVDSEEELFEALTRLGKQLNARFLAALGRSPAPPVAVVEEPEVTGPSRGTRRFFPVPLAAGAIVGAAGVFCFVLADSAWTRLTAGPQASLTQAQAKAVAQEGQLFQVAGSTLALVGVAAVASGLGLLLFGSKDTLSPSAVLVPTATGAAIAGTF